MQRRIIYGLKRLPGWLGGGLVELSTIRTSPGKAEAFRPDGAIVSVDLHCLFSSPEAEELYHWLKDAHEQWLRSINRVMNDVYRESPYRVGGPKEHPWHHSNFTVAKLNAAFKRGASLEAKDGPEENDACGA